MKKKVPQVNKVGQQSIVEANSARPVSSLDFDYLSLIQLIDESQLNPNVVHSFLSQLAKTSLSPHFYGQIRLQIEDGTCLFVRTEEATKINEKIVRLTVDELAEMYGL